MQFHLFAAFLFTFVVVSAWMPEDKNLFGDTESHLPAGHGRTVKRYLPATKIRGVNLGSLFVFEPWMATTTWNNIGCGTRGAKSEFGCVRPAALGQEAANTAFQNHWQSWINETDFANMRAYGLNTVRIPIGYWMHEAIVDSSEYFPQGGYDALKTICGMAANYGLYIILGMHGAPGAQKPLDAFTGQYAEEAGFYSTYNYERAYQFLTWLTQQIHSNTEFRTVGMIEVANEPIPAQPTLASLYYPGAYAAIRAAELAAGVTAGTGGLHIQFMDTSWGAGNPISSLTSTTGVSFDNHRYLKYDSSVETTQSGYLGTSCNDDLGATGNTPLIVGEWSISPSSTVEDTADFIITGGANADFYQKWWAAQVVAYEKNAAGWVFWAWKSELMVFDEAKNEWSPDWRWSYSEAVKAGIFPTDPGQAYNVAACS